MNAAAVQVIISVITVVVSVCGAAFVSGTRWGRVETDIRSLNDRLARIEGMFTLRLRPDGDGSERGHASR